LPLDAERARHWSSGTRLGLSFTFGSSAADDVTDHTGDDGHNEYRWPGLLDSCHGVNSLLLVWLGRQVLWMEFASKPVNNELAHGTMLSESSPLYPNSAPFLIGNQLGQPLAPFPIVSTRDTDEAESVLSRELADLRIKRVHDRRSFRLDMNGVHLGQTMLGYNRFGADTIVDPGLVDESVVLAIGVGPASVFTIDGEPVDSTKRLAVLSASKRVLIHRAPASELLLLRAGVDAVDKRFREALGRRPERPLAFDPSADIDGGVGAQVHRLVRSLIEDFEQSPAVLENLLLRAGFDDLLLSAILALPNNYSNELMDVGQSSVPPGLVRRAEEYLNSHATEPITISDVVAECGCSRKALFNAFRAYRGYTPMQFLADTRLRAARAALRSPCPWDSVTSIAYACGFSHLGRFSQAYFKRFGESPSETLRKSR
jgi:AraC-like DNA-binding protein